jgi:peptidoglycan/LPS O-acetylase OafA/YrhL
MLDSWRGIAACMVALFHLEANSHIEDLAFVRNSWLFVDFFFVLSGFVIAANYQRRLLDGFGFWRFVLLRFGRLYPLHLFVLAVFLGLKAIQAQVPVLSSVARNQPFGLRDSPVAIAANLLLVHSMGVLDFLSFNILSWSVSTEFWAYIAFERVLCSCETARDRRSSLS